MSEGLKRQPHPRPHHPRPPARTLLANERTFLAELRTAVTLMAFGFVVARFALFLADLHGASPSPAHTHGLDRVTGACITLLGALVAWAAAVRFVRRRRSLLAGQLTTDPGLDVSLAALVGLAGVGLALYLMLAL